jgi:uncharacterized protein with PQ loop repeat
MSGEEISGLSASQKVILEKPHSKRSKYSLKVDKCQLDENCDPPKWKIYYAYGILAWAVLSHTFELLQAIKIYTEKNAEGVSLPAFALWIFGAIVWGVYGAFVLNIPNWPIIVSAIIAFLLGVVVLTGVIIYG